MDLVPNAAQLFLPRLEGLVACLACWHALVQAGRKQLLTLPERTFFNSLSCSEELCCLIFFFFFPEHVQRRLLVLPPAASLFTAGLCNVSILGKGAVQIAQKISHRVGQARKLSQH